jgi:DNA-binding HxlR family transcriptional regulator
MALPRDYASQVCSMARSLEIVGERWTLLIVRDALYGVRRFSDFRSHLGIPRAVLTERLGFLVAEGILDRVPGSGGRDEYAPTTKGVALLPVLRALGVWGDRYYAPDGPVRVYTHADCGGALDATNRCAKCGVQVPAADIVTAPTPAGQPAHPDADRVSRALRSPHRLLTPLPIEAPPAGGR